MEELKLNVKELDKEKIELFYYLADSVKNEPYILEMKERIENGDIELNIIKEWEGLRNENNMFPQYPPLGKLSWLLVNYIFGKLQRMKAILESDIKTKPIGSIFLNSVKSQEAIIFYMLDKGLLDIVSYKEEIEICKIGFPDDKVIKFSERALNKYQISKNPPPEQTPPPHFTQLFTQEQLLKLYTGLTTGSFLPKDATGVDFKAFCYILGNGKQEDFKCLDWIGFIKDLNAFINTFYNGERSKWKKTVSSFTWENNLINQNSLKTANDAYDEDPPSTEYFKMLKKNIQ